VAAGSTSKMSSAIAIRTLAALGGTSMARLGTRQSRSQLSSQLALLSAATTAPNRHS
jgi:hypothetical protein